MLITLGTGFLFGTVGAMWSFLFVDRLAKDIGRLSDTRAELNKQIQLLNGIASDYFIANQQGDLIFILAQQGNARQDLAGLVYKGNLLDRATPVRNMLGALAIARQLDYRKAYDAYEKLNDEARKDLTFANFLKLKEMEKAIIGKGQERVPLLLNELFATEKAMSASEAAEGRNRVIGLICAIFGNFLLLLSNLFAGGAPPERPETPNDRKLETTIINDEPQQS